MTLPTTPLEYPTYLDHIRSESARFREVLADCPPDARVPSCPDWDAADLLWHLAEVQLFWAKVVRHRPAAPDDPEIADEPKAERPKSYAELLEAFDDYSHALVTELERADPEAVAWHWSGDNRVGTSYRRQAHEALIHRVDAELAAGVAVSPLDTALAADGVAEILGVMYGGCPAWGTFTPGGQTIGVHLTDTGTDLLVELGRFTGTDPDDGKSYDEDDLALVDPSPGAAPAPGASISGTAADLDAWLWKRTDAAGIQIGGDPDAYARLAAILGQPIN